MTPEEERLVLNWLRSRGADPYDGGPKLERHILQRALRNGEHISRDIRDAMANWLIAEPERFIPGPSNAEKDQIAKEGLAWARKAKKAYEKAFKPAPTPKVNPKEIP